MYVDGVEMASVSDSTNYTGTNLVIGGIFSTSFLMSGHIDEFRISNTARYTTNFTPSSTPFTNDDNTLLLIHANGADASTAFYDDTGSRTQKGIQAINNAKIDTAQSKFGGASLFSDAVIPNPYLDIQNINLNLSEYNSWTVEFWMYISSTSTGGRIINCAEAGTFNGFMTRLTGVGNNNQIEWHSWNGSTIAARKSSNNAYSLNQWNHFAFTNNSGNFQIFANGTSVFSVSGFVNVLASNASYNIGGGVQATTGPWGARDYTTFTAGGLGSWLDEIRFSNTARYTANFTAPSAPFQNDDNTLLLLHMNGTDGSTVFFDDNGRTPTP
jgi:hypothetical protein